MTRNKQRLTSRWLGLSLWLACAALHGQDVYFRRGDANVNGTVDLSDAVFTLAYLFQGGSAPSCNDAADANDSGKVDLSDAIYTLGHLFLGGPAPPAPGLECGWDPTPDEIYCLSYPACLQPSRSFDVIDGYAIVEGDIIIGRPEDVPVFPDLRSPGPGGGDSEDAGGGAGDGSSDGSRRWPGAVVPYTINSDVPNQNRITDAIAHWEASTQIRFVGRSDQANYVTFQSASECSSKVGMQGGQQVINIGSDCTTGNMIHEIGHCVGLYHEQGRADRDDHVKILWDNIIPEKKDQFAKSTDSWDLGFYDHGSIMHYGSDFFGIKDSKGNAKITIETIPAGIAIGQRSALSAGDRDAVDALYGGWREPFQLGDGSAGQRGIVSVSRIPNSMEVWWIGYNGSVQAAFWYEGGVWTRYELAPAGSASTTGGITAVSRIPGSMEVWWIGANGSVQAAFWYEGGVWTRYELAPAGSASTTGGIAAVSRIPGSLEVWWVGANGSVQDAYWYENSTWQRFELAPAGSASTSGGITAVSRIPGSMEMWWVGANGSVQDAFWYESSVWQRFELAPAGSASTSGGITAVSRIPGSMEVWWVGANGSVQDAFWYESSVWQGFELAPAGSASTSGGITAVSRIPGSMEVWWVGANGSIQDAYWYENAQWQRFELASAGKASTSGGITAVSRVQDSMEVWWVGAGGSVQDAYWYP